MNKAQEINENASQIENLLCRCQEHWQMLEDNLQWQPGDQYRYTPDILPRLQACLQQAKGMAVDIILAIKHNDYIFKLPANPTWACSGCLRRFQAALDAIRCPYCGSAHIANAGANVAPPTPTGTAV